MSEPIPDPRSPERRALDTERIALVSSEEAAHKAWVDAQEKLAQYYVRRIQAIPISPYLDEWADLAAEVIGSGNDCLRCSETSRMNIREASLKKLYELTDRIGNKRK